MISAARFSYLSTLMAAARARPRLGGSWASHSAHVLALVITAASDCLISCAREAAISPNMLTRFDVCKIVLELTQFLMLLLGTFAIFNVGEGSVPLNNLSIRVAKWD